MQDMPTYLAVRPENLMLSAEKPAEELNAVKGGIMAETHLGDRRQFLVAINDQMKPITVSQQISGTGSGGEVWVAWPAQLGRLLTA